MAAMGIFGVNDLFHMVPPLQVYIWRKANVVGEPPFPALGVFVAKIRE
jgi:hypothetical protein